MPEEQNHNDPLENIFRKKAEEYDISFREQDWLSLEEKLDHHQAITSYKRRIRWGAAAALLIVATLGYFTYQNNSKIDQLAQQLKGDTPSENTPSTDTQTDSSTDTVTRLDPLLLDQESSENSPNTSTQNPSITNNQITETNRPGTATNVNSENTGVNLTNNAGEEFIDGSNLPVWDDSLFITQNLDISTVAISAPPSGNADFSEKNLINTKPNQLAFNSAIPQGSSAIRKSSKDLEIGLLLSPDLSSVGGISNFHDPGYKFGITIGYQITDNISLSSGLIQSKVNYTAQPQNYNIPDYGSYGIPPNKMFAECIILDIPIKLKYNFYHTDRSRFFSSAGLSTYVMLNEDYQFSYSPIYGSQQEVAEWNVKSGKAHLMSNIGLSVGYEYDMHSNWSISAEPFIKVPLKNVGWGNVKLYSMGTFISLNYRL